MPFSGRDCSMTIRSDTVACHVFRTLAKILNCSRGQGSASRFIGFGLWYVMLLMIVGCQSTDSSEIDADLIAQMKVASLAREASAEMRQRKTFRSLYQIKCRTRWSGDISMIAYCEKHQEPKMRQFVFAKLLFDSTSRKNGAFAEQVKFFNRCGSAYSGDYEMAMACIENERAIDLLSRQ